MEGGREVAVGGVEISLAATTDICSTVWPGSSLAQ